MPLITQNHLPSKDLDLDLGNTKIEKSNKKWTVPSETNLVLEKDLIIPNGVSLNIEEGVSIKIKKGKSIYLKGDLIINGSNLKPVTISSLTKEPWGGIFVASEPNKKSNVIINSVIFKNFGSFPKTKINNMFLN